MRVLIFFFFFSSRRRHTRCGRDWSSDVCSSDLFLPLTVLNNPVMRTGTISASLAMGVSIGLTIFVPLYFELVHGLSATESGIALIPLALTTPGSLLSGQAMLYWRHYKLAPVIGLVCALVALGF